MILESHAEMNATLRTVFTIFAVAWIGIVLILFVATGLLLKRAETLRKKQQHSAGGHH
jgi:hypothetical protein